MSQTVPATLVLGSTLMTIIYSRVVTLATMTRKRRDWARKTTMTFLINRPVASTAHHNREIRTLIRTLKSFENSYVGKRMYDGRENHRLRPIQCILAP